MSESQRYVIECDTHYGTNKTATHGVNRRPPFLLTQILGVNPKEPRAAQYVRVLSLGRCCHGHVGAFSPPFVP
jgi:hypothetical protein